MTYAAAYLRRSSVSGDSPGDASREAQIAAVEALATLHAPDTDLVQYVDWGISGRRHDRPEYLRLKAAVEAGEVCCVFAYSLSRLGRSNGELDAFFRLCATNNVTVYTKAEGALGKTSAMGGFLLTIMSAMAELESELAKERSEAARAVKLARGDKLGQAPYGYRLGSVDGRLDWVRDGSVDMDAIRRAYVASGSVLGACNLLKDRGIPAPRGGSEWSTSMVTRTIEREWPELLPARRQGVDGATGRRRRASAPLSGLLRCPFCNRMLTPNVTRGQYYCAKGPRERATHPRYAVREVDVLPWIMDEADRLDIPADAVEVDDLEARRQAVEERWQRARRVFVDEGDEVEYRAAQDRYRTTLAALDGEATLAGIAHAVDWDAPAQVINTALRAMWREVRLGADLLPVEAEWIVPAWRTHDDADLTR
jgi:DNA invertase Pin-like site-specific DNA recombinase